jgi:hypothetical protein
LSYDDHHPLLRIARSLFIAIVTTKAFPAVALPPSAPLRIPASDVKLYKRECGRGKINIYTGVRCSFRRFLRTLAMQCPCGDGCQLRVNPRSQVWEIPHFRCQKYSCGQIVETGQRCPQIRIIICPCGATRHFHPPEIFQNCHYTCTFCHRLVETGSFCQGTTTCTYCGSQWPHYAAPRMYGRRGEPAWCHYQCEVAGCQVWLMPLDQCQRYEICVCGMVFPHATATSLDPQKSHYKCGYCGAHVITGTRCGCR